MSESALSLGPMAFRDFEIPSAITFGGRQRLAVHYLGTGRRITDVLGPDDATISFTGVLSGSQATQRAREIDTLRSLGLPLTLAWNTFSYLVVISSFRSEYRNRWWVPYTVSCAVLENPLIPGALSALPAAAEALAALDFMYTIVPSNLLPLTDLRSTLPSNVSSITRSDSASTLSTLLVARDLLNAQRQNREAQSVRLSFGDVVPLSAVMNDLSSMAQIAGDLQYLALSQDCLGQASALLAQEN
jgi:hypothetical protein